MKCVGVVMNKDLELDIYSKGRITMARKMLRALNGIGNSQWGICPNSWRSAYRGMIGSIIL